jgi:hypothetical protein
MKFTPGPAIASASGAIGGTVFSRNRYGAYTRNRAIPVQPINDNTTAAKSRMIAASQNWGLLDDSERLAWATWAASNPIIDALGQSQILQGNSAYVQVATRLLLLGEALPDLPGAGTAPPSLATLTATWDIGAGAFALTYTPTPLQADEHLWCYAAVTNSAGKTYIQNLRKLVYVGAAATATGVDLQTSIEDRFGDLQVGQYITVDAFVASDVNGLLSAPLRVSGQVVETS